MHADEYAYSASKLRQKQSLTNASACQYGDGACVLYRQNSTDMHTGRLRVGRAEARLKRGPLMTSSYSANCDRPFDQAKEGDLQATQGYVPETTA